MSSLNPSNNIQPEIPSISRSLPQSIDVRETVALELLTQARELKKEAVSREQWEKLASLFTRIEALLDPASRHFSLTGDLSAEGVIHKVELPGRINSIATSLDGAMIVVGSGGREGAVDLFAYDSSGLTHLQSETLKSPHIARKITLNADNSLLAVAYDDGSLHVHQLQHQHLNPIPLFKEKTHGTLIRGLTFLNDTTLVATVSDRSLMVLELNNQSGKMVEIGRYSGNQIIRDIATSTDGSKIYLLEAEIQSEGNGLKVLDTNAKTGNNYKVKAIRRLSRPSALAAKPSGDEVVVGEHSGWVYLYDTKTAAVQKVGYPTSGPVRDISYSPTGELFAVAEGDSKGGIEVFKLLKEGRLSRVAHFNDNKGCTTVCFSQSQVYLVAGSADGTLRVFTA